MKSLNESPQKKGVINIIVNVSSKGDKEVAETMTALVENSGGVFLSVNPFGLKETEKLRDNNPVEAIVDALGASLKDKDLDAYEKVNLKFVGHVCYKKKSDHSSSSGGTMDGYAYPQNQKVTSTYLGAVNSDDLPELIEGVLSKINSQRIAMKFVVCNSEDIVKLWDYKVANIMQKYEKIEELTIKTTPYSVTSNLLSFRRKDYIDQKLLSYDDYDSDIEVTEKGLLARVVAGKAQKSSGSFSGFKYLSDSQKADLLPKDMWTKRVYRQSVQEKEISHSVGVD